MTWADHVDVGSPCGVSKLVDFETAFAHEQSRGFNTPVVSFGASTSRPFSTGN